MNIKTIKEKVSLCDFLSSLGFEPMKKSGSDFFYLSPIRNTDTNPSFAVNNETGKWYDHGLGTGGNIIDLALLLYPESDLQSVLSHFNQFGQFKISSLPVTTLSIETEFTPKHYQITDIKEIGSNTNLNAYLYSRGINAQPNKLLKEIYYSIKTNETIIKNYYAIGWQNEAGGWEIRNKFFKACLGNKDLTIIDGKEPSFNIFEGMFDYQSFLIYQKEPFKGTTIILNSLSLSKRAISRIQNSKQADIGLYLDNDPAGKIATRKFQSSFSQAKDFSEIYANFKDMNDWHLFHFKNKLLWHI